MSISSPTVNTWWDHTILPNILYVMPLLILKISYPYSPGWYPDSSPRAGNKNDDNNDNILQDIQITRISIDLV